MMPEIIDTRVPRHTGLNRTFYGIEITVEYLLEHLLSVLIVPFMELKWRTSPKVGRLQRS